MVQVESQFPPLTPLMPRHVRCLDDVGIPLIPGWLKKKLAARLARGENPAEFDINRVG